MYAALQLGGFGLSRYVMDDALHRLAKRYGAKVLTDTRITAVDCEDGFCIAHTADGAQYKALLNIGSWGKRDTLDKKLERDFINSHTGYMGVKYHIRTHYPIDEIGLDNFPGGYCGITKIEGDLYNLCYLYQRNFGGHFKSVKELEDVMLFQNPVLRQLFQESEFVSDQPEVINEICFAPKQQVVKHVLLCGDTAGLITPLCGNGMSMAIAAARLLANTIIQSGILRRRAIPDEARATLEQNYTKAWRKQFGQRLYWGRTIQRFFGALRLSEIVLRGIHAIPPAERWLIRQTHGRPM
jgi:flavin-dependent dehydrogenase